MTLETRFADRMDQLLQGAVPARMGVAVSGGSDSTALMCLAAGWAAKQGVELRVATVDHGLRTEAAEEARRVRQQAELLGLSHETLCWDDWDGQGNLQDVARRARRRLLWSWSRGFEHVLIGHTMDDQAETVLRNLARGSGVAGLSGMSDRARLPPPTGPMPGRNEDQIHDPQLLRPLLAFRREDLRDWLRAGGIGWIEDPSNEDSRYDRVRTRKALAEGKALGLTVEGLAETARRQGRARQALELRAQDAARRMTSIEHGDVVLDREALAALDAETRLHVVAHALRWVSSSDYRPRMISLETALSESLGGRAVTLHGCVLRAGRGGLRVYRELKAVSGLAAVADGPILWDRRWKVEGVDVPGCEIRAAGEAGLLQAKALPEWCPERGAPKPPHASLLAAPALFLQGQLIALPPFAGAPCRLKLCPPMGGFIESMLSR
ncbi:tRNA lysidine(34) synthetase TilS [Tropicimonas sp. TH_r6]|uniref:tRNA lysidine(34) synthetase TilS n=1 Tax=Tropicimonas sp. TH_r6 TaxID=3082085 RepID=UPI0029550875|nr:tRNA lysidine(34) synthetase TilS [Tropicimonas sp. TH_r6]MDV7145180.1 tRNA lysidine(34) synthetase TilS [Tropicimonas sp. TH_r6]